jgi:hypothetical protein
VPSRKNFDLLCEILSKDLFLAKYFLIVEAIEGNTLQTIKMVSIRTAQSLSGSDAVKNSKVLKLFNSAKIANSFIQDSFKIIDVPTINAFKTRSSKLIAGLEFLFAIEDLATTLTNENTGITKAFLERQKKLEALAAGNTQELETDSSNTTTSAISATNADEAEKEAKDPTIETILGSNASKTLILNILKVLSKKVQITKDVPSVKFFSNVGDLKNPSLNAMRSTDFRATAIDITKLSYSQFQNLLQILQTLGGMISRIRQALGSSTTIEIRNELLKEPNNDKNSSAK